MFWKWGIHASGVSVRALVAASLSASAGASATVYSPFGGPAIPEGVPAVASGDAASLSLKVYATPNISTFLNAAGDVAVTRGSSFTGIGAAPSGFGSYTMQATWDEHLGATTNTVRVVWQTSNGQRLVPANATIGGLSVGYLEWRVGATNPVSWTPGISHVELIGAFLGVSTDGGASQSTFEITASLTNPWNGTSFGTTLPISAIGAANYIEAKFIYAPVPLPSPLSAGAVGLAMGLCVGRRRRRP